MGTCRMCARQDGHYHRKSFYRPKTLAMMAAVSWEAEELTAASLPIESEIVTEYIWYEPVVSPHVLRERERLESRLRDTAVRFVLNEDGRYDLEPEILSPKRKLSLAQP